MTHIRYLVAFGGFAEVEYADGVVGGHGDEVAVVDHEVARDDVLQLQLQLLHHTHPPPTHHIQNERT